MAIYVWEKIKDYLTKAGTTIFLASIILWFVMNVGPAGFISDVADSFAAKFGQILVPVLKPVGLGSWQIAVALISGISAKEVVVSSMSVLYGIGNINSAAGMAELSGILGGTGIHSSERLCAHGILPSLYTVYCDDRDDQERNTVLEMDIGDGHVPACACLVGGISCIPDRKPPVLIKKNLETITAAMPGRRFTIVDLAANGLYSGYKNKRG